MRPLGSQSYGTGNVYEACIYTLTPGEFSKVLARWAKAIPVRKKYSPLAACWYSEVSGLNKFVHVWAYKRIGVSKYFLSL
jgi:NIPSNAP